MSETAFTFADLKKAVNLLSEEQLQKQVFVQREDEVVKVGDLSCLEEDIYYNDGDDDVDDRGTLEELQEAHGEDFIRENYKLANPKGTAYLYEDF